MKSLLISLMAFLCVLGVNATPTGSGTQEDPYVIADGDNYVVNAPVYASLTSNEDETGLIVTAQFVEIGTQTPKEINEFGAYVLKVDSQSIANELFNEETPWTDGLQGHGICNPDFTVAFNIDPVIITVESVDPAPYVEGGEYSKEIPAEIKIT